LNVTARVDVPWDGSIGERTWTVSTTGTTTDHRLGIGQGRLDLRGLVLQQDTTVQASVGFGHLWITVPEGVRVHVTGTVSVGAYDVFLPGVEGAGRHGDGNGIAVDTTYGPDSGPVLTLDTEVGVGYLEVDHA
ncbi:MAG: phage shock protein (PspC) protein, partial [Frankiales bacterium]|nr:phage shock protein (PspC) protein [Frankiales bacterium]